MTPRHCIVFPTVENLLLEAASRIMGLVSKSVQEERGFYLVLAGGSTPKRLYEILADQIEKSGAIWNHVHIFFGDERCVKPDHPDSNFKMATDAFLSKVKLPDSHIHRLKGEADPATAALDYENEIRTAFGLVVGDCSIPSFDLVLLGMGADGHTASLFPETVALTERSKMVVANWAPRLSAYRLTMTPVILTRSARVFFLVTGADKAKRLSEVLEGPYCPNQTPAQLVSPDAGEITWFIDNAAATDLTSYEKHHSGQ